MVTYKKIGTKDKISAFKLPSSFDDIYLGCEEGWIFSHYKEKLSLDDKAW